MKTIYIFLILLAIGQIARGERLIPSRLDPKLTEARENAFIPWSNPEESSVYWNKLHSSNVPLYNERKHGNLSRDIYVPNPGIGYWVLGSLSETALWKTQGDKLKIGDELVSASVYKDEKGVSVYWALWAPKNRSYLLKDKMRQLGITPAMVELTLADKLKAFSTDFAPFLGVAVVVIFAFQLILLVLVVVLLVRLRKPIFNQ